MGGVNAVRDAGAVVSALRSDPKRTSVGFARALVNLDALEQEGVAYWIGTLVPDLALTIATAGAGTTISTGRRSLTSATRIAAATDNIATKLDNIATNTATRIGDDLVGVGDDVFTHGYAYSPRIRARAVQDPVGHNFPYSYDDVILKSTPVAQADGSLLYRVPGSINSKDGFFEIAVNPSTETIFHRTFVGG
jgi:hypothetical protein